jgi:predicted XRE-type DNA-binding protein
MTDAAGEVMSGYETPAFATVDIPTTKPPEEFSTEERRAALLRSITDLGHPSMLNQTEAAERYGVSQPMISKDLDVLADHVADRLGDRHELEIESVFRRSIRGLLEEEEWRKAAQTAGDYADWMTERSDLEALREELDLLKEATDLNS